jgi:hypothetical protein
MSLLMPLNKKENNVINEEFNTYILSTKTKLNEIINKHNCELFNSIETSYKIPRVIELAENVFKQFNHTIPTFNGYSTIQLLKDINLDASISLFFDNGLQKIIEDSDKNYLQIYLKQTKWLYEQYILIGEEVLSLESVLYQKIDMLEKLQNNSKMLSCLKNNEYLPNLIDSFKKYADSILISINFEDTYKEIVKLYKKWNTCRQIIQLSSNFRNEIHDPQCSICLLNPVSNAIVPCGHTFCEGCIKKQNINCYICRETIKDRIKLYFT